MAEKTRYMTITYNNGKKQKFEFQLLSEDPNIAISKLEKMLASGHLVMKCDDRAFVIPLSSVQNIEVLPAPDKMPGFAVQAIRELE
jgi:hypothetical protein